MESRKKGIAIAAITALVAYQPSNYIELSVAVGVVIIVLYAINRQSNLDKGEKK